MRHLYRAAWLLCGDRHRAEDLVQETLAKVYGHWGPGISNPGRPSQGDAAPAANKELLVELYTPDGYVILVDSHNTPAEKSGGVVAADPVLTVAESLALARSPRWFVAK